MSSIDENYLCWILGDDFEEQPNQTGRDMALLEILRRMDRNLLKDKKQKHIYDYKKKILRIFNIFFTY